MAQMNPALRRRLQGMEADARGPQGILSRGNNIYNGGSMAAHSGGGINYPQQRQPTVPPTNPPNQGVEQNMPTAAQLQPRPSALSGQIPQQQQQLSQHYTSNPSMGGELSGQNPASGILQKLFGQLGNRIPGFSDALSGAGFSPQQAAMGRVLGPGGGQPAPQESPQGQGPANPAMLLAALTGKLPPVGPQSAQAIQRFQQAVSR